MLGKKTRRYLSYAVGELVLVVFGILIALQINNWNEERIEQRQIADYAHALIKDLERDLAMIEVIRTEIDVLINKIDTLAAYIENRSIEEFRNVDLYYLMRAPFYRPYAWNRTALEQIKSSGAMRQMKNQELAEKISAYEHTNLSLLTDNMEDIKVVVNSYLTLGGYYGIRPRAEIEMPRLAANARGLIVLLKEEYPE